MIDEEKVLIGFDVSKAHLSWLPLNMSLTRLDLDKLYDAYTGSEPDLRGMIVGIADEFIKRVMRLTDSEKELLSGPLFQVAGMFAIGEPGWADKHDEYLAETYVDHLNL
jgi:hypothetical protein